MAETIRTLAPNDIVITGYARNNSLGGTKEAWRRQLAGETEITLVTGEDLGLQNKAFRDIAAPVGFRPSEYPVLSEQSVVKEHLSEYGQMVMAISDEAARMAGILDDNGRLISGINPRKAGMAVGYGAGSSIYMSRAHNQAVERAGKDRPFKPSAVKSQFLEQAAARVEERMGLQGYALEAAEACATGVSITSDAYYSLKDGRNEIVLVGAYEYLAEDPELAFADFHSFNALSKRRDDPSHASRPFDKDRDGFVLSLAEAGSLVMETYEHAQRRGAKVLAVLNSANKGSDGFDATTMDKDRASDLISETAGDLRPFVIFEHATSTPLGDVAETDATLRSSLGINRRKLRIYGGKGMRGHSLGATGMQTILDGIESLRTGWVPPTINLETLDPKIEELGLTMDNFVRTATKLDPQTIFVGAFGFGGKNAVAFLSKPPNF